MLTSPPYWSDRLVLRRCKEHRCVLHDLARSCVGPERRQHKLATPLGNENLAIMADLSNSNNMMTLEGLPEDLRKDIDIHLHTHCYRVTEQGVIMMKMFVIGELRMFDLPEHCKSTAKFITDLLSFVDELINKEKSVDPILVIRKSAIEKLANNPCKNLPDVAGQDTIRLSQAEIVEAKSPGKRSEERRVGKECGYQCRSRWSPYH